GRDGLALETPGLRRIPCSPTLVSTGSGGDPATLMATAARRDDVHGYGGDKADPEQTPDRGSLSVHEQAGAGPAGGPGELTSRDSNAASTALRTSASFLGRKTGRG